MLIYRTEVIVRFNEADPLGIVWHGHYLRYFEDGREAFGMKYGISYLDFYKNGLAVPVVSAQCDYKKPLRYGNSVIVESIYEPTNAAKLKFSYNMYESVSNDLVAVGSTMQVFVDIKNFQLQLTVPEFFQAWKKKMEV
ncbi:acyl-CoA thioesterase [Ohtaekwangia kribbensis]|uniref:Acyl-CoA thioesterase n=1 Tax=Ohtaekwangia kribbensis TaxID=688913 RepID=A0ABW3K184_9BACT